MLITFIIAALIIAIIILATDYKTEWSRYLSAIIFMGALSGLSDEINNSLIPFIKANLIVETSTIEIIYRFHAALTQFCEHIGIFLVVMYCVSYSDLLDISKKRLATLFILIIAAFSYFIHPWLTTDEQIAANVFRKYYFDLSLWGAPLLIAGLIMLYIAYFKERNPGLIRQRFINLLLATPLILSGTLNLLILKAIGFNHNIGKTNLIVMLTTIAVFIIFALRDGAFGIRIKIDRQSVIGSIDTISEGTAIINHTLKNEVGKLSMATSNIKSMVSNENCSHMGYDDNIEVLRNSVSNLDVMIKRMQNFSGNIKLQESLFSIEEILDKAVFNVSIFLKEKNIILEKNYSYNIKIQCDENHLIEAITNILKNSCEALSSGNRIVINTYGNKNILYVSIYDNGPGIKKEYLSKVFEPFFTTKEGSKNFGFGLSYAYKVLNKHQGDLNVYSKENVGTTVTLSLPRFRIKGFDKNLPTRSKLWVK